MLTTYQTLGTFLILVALVLMVRELSKVDSKDQSAERWKCDFIRELTLISRFTMSFDEINKVAADWADTHIDVGDTPEQAADIELQIFKILKLAKGIK